MVKCKGEICLAAAEVDDAQGAAGRQIFKNVVDNLKIPVYLAEFAVGTWKDLSVPAHYTQLYEKVAWNAVGDNIIFGFKLSLFVVDKEDFSKSDPSIFVILSIEESEALSIRYLAL